MGYGIRIIPDMKKNLMSVIKRGKDITSKFEKSCVVYRVACHDCNASYVGQTGRVLKTRIEEHQRDVVQKKESSVFYT